MGRDTLWMNNLRKYMSYKRVQDIAFPWSYEELLSMPLFMIYHIYEMLDEFIEIDKQKQNAASSSFG